MKFFFLFFFSLLNLYSEKIELRDGTVIYGDFEGVIDNYYVIRTRYGVLSVSTSEVLGNINISTNIAILDNKSDLVELKIITHKTDNGYKRYFYENSVIIATQVFNTDLSSFSVEGIVKDGIYYEYDENGNMISERTIKNGLENGPVIEFYPDGIVKSRIDFKDGKINGKAMFYTPDSKLILEQTFSNGILDGFSVEYDLDGNVKSKVLYSNGKLANTLDEDKKQEKKKDNNEGGKEVISEDSYSVKIINIARGKKVFVHRNNKYIGSFTFDSDYNVIDVTGKIPDRDYEIKDSKNNIVFKFVSNWPKELTVIKQDEEIKYIYNENGEAIKKK